MAVAGGAFWRSARPVCEQLGIKYPAGLPEGMDVDIFPQPEPAGDLRRPALRRHGPGTDGRAAHQLLRVPLPLHQRHPSRRKSRNVQGMALMKLFFHPGTNMAQAMAETINYVNRSRAFMPPGTVSPVRDAVRHRQRAGRLSGAVERNADDRRRFRTWHCSACGRCSRACRAFRRRRRSAAGPHDRRHGRSRPPAGLRHVAGRRDHGADEGQHDQPLGQHLHIGDKYPIVPVNSMVKRHRANWETFPSAPGRTPCLSARHRPRSRTPPTLRPAMRWSMAAGRSISWPPSGPTPRR